MANIDKAVKDAIATGYMADPIAQCLPLGRYSLAPIIRASRTSV